jgi:hypothetical protein
VLAQQQINNDGATASDIQQQVGSEYFQQNTGGQQASDVMNNAGSTVIQNAPNQPLEVSGAPANSVEQDTKSGFRWVIIFGLFFLILLSPALLYVRDMQKTGEITDDIGPLKAPKEEKVVQVVAKEEKKVTKKKPAKKKSATKTKRGKKARK